MDTMNSFSRPSIISCIQRSPYILKEGCLQLDIHIAGSGWLKVEAIGKQSRKLGFWDEIKDLKLRLISKSRLLSSILLYQQTDDLGRITIHEFKKQNKTVIFQKFTSSGVYSVIIPEGYQFRIKVSNFGGATELWSKAPVTRNIDDSLNLSREYFAGIKQLNQSQLLARLERTLNSLPSFQDEIDQLSTKYISLVNLNYRQVKKFQNELQKSLDLFDVKRLSNVRFQYKVSPIDFNTMRQEWNEVSNIIHEVNKH